MGILVLSVGVSFLKRSLAVRLPADAKLNGQSLIVLDNAGRTLWTYAFDRKLNSVVANPQMQFARVVDLLDNGDREMIAVLPFARDPNGRDGTDFEVVCFSSRGRRLWSYTPSETFHFGAHELHGPWQVFDLIVSQRKERKAIYVALVHNAWGNSFVSELDPSTGRSTVRYVNTGTIRALGELATADITYLVAGGFNNEYEGGSAALIDERKPFAASPQTDGTRHKCNSCPAGAPDYYLVFSQSEANRILKGYENAVEAIKVIGGEVQFQKFESADRISDGLYLFGFQPRIFPISLRYPSPYDDQHRELERNGTLHHSLEECPERLRSSAVRMWTPANGWTDLQFAASRFDQ